MPVHPRILPPNLSRTFAIEVALLLISACGFGTGGHDIFSSDAALSRHAMIIMVVGGVIPMTLFVFIAVRKFIQIGQLLSSAAYQARIDELQKRINAQDDFFSAINNHLPLQMVIYNNQNCIWFANKAASKALGLSESELIGKSPADVLGIERGSVVTKNLEKAQASVEPFTVLDHRMHNMDDEVYIRTVYQQLPALGDFRGGIMTRSEDVTEAVLERARREDMLRRIIATLIGVVDRRDPYASGHSSRVGELSRAMAQELHLGEGEIEAAEIAGSLMNFGKILVSRRVLTKTEALTPDELQRVRDGLMSSADILSPIDFGVPVVPTLRQVLERFDGSGVPEHARGEAILMTARIVSVANSFVALVSPRAYREGLDGNTATECLAKDVGKAFDPRVIDALKAVLFKNAERFTWLVPYKVTPPQD